MERCPHCYRPCFFPNMNAARRPEEKEHLQRRYDEAIAAAQKAGMETILREYEAMVTGSAAVIGRNFGELMRLSHSENEIYATFYQRVDAGLLLAGGDAWDRIRAIADTILFGEENKRQVRFAALTLDGHGLPHYGDCSLILREEMIAHRTTVFEENSVIFMRHHNINAEHGYAVPQGYRAEWADRAKLAVAKTKGNTAGLSPATFATFLQDPGQDESKDVFVEAHIWGSLSVRSIREVHIRRWTSAPPSVAQIDVVAEKLRQYGVSLTPPAIP